MKLILGRSWIYSRRNHYETSKSSRRSSGAVASLDARMDFVFYLPSQVVRHRCTTTGVSQQTFISVSMSTRIPTPTRGTFFLCTITNNLFPSKHQSRTKMRQRQTLVATFRYKPGACLSAKATWDRLYRRSMTNPPSSSLFFFHNPPDFTTKCQKSFMFDSCLFAERKPT